MDMIATFGSMVITEGANVANIASAHSAPHQHKAIDAVFSGYSAQAAPPLPMTLMVVAACTASVKEALQDAIAPDDEEEKSPQAILAEQRPVDPEEQF
jgi:hypothetical protein